jgi:PAS domain-containing protein
VPAATSDPLLDVLLDSVDADVVVVDRAVHVVLANERAARTIGLSEMGPTSAPLGEVAPGLAAAVGASIRAVIADGAARRSQPVEARLADGRRRSWSVDLLPLTDDGAVERVAVVARDRAPHERSEVDRALAEARLAIAEVASGSRWSPGDAGARALHDRLAAMGPALDGLFESSGAGLVLVSLDGRVRRANPTFARMVGRALVDVVGAPLVALSPPTSGRPEAFDVDRSGPSTWTAVIGTEDAGTTVRVVEWPLTDDDGRAVCALAVLAPDTAVSDADAALPRAR